MSQIAVAYIVLQQPEDDACIEVVARSDGTYGFPIVLTASNGGIAYSLVMLFVRSEISFAPAVQRKLEQ